MNLSEQATPRYSLDEIIAAYLEAIDAGKQPNQKKILARYSYLHSELQSFFASMNRFSPQPSAPLPGTDPYPPLPNPFPEEFRFLKRLGEGGFGTLWLAEDLQIRRKVAIKTLKGSSDERRARALNALMKDAQLLARISHPNIIPVYAMRRDGDEYYLILKYISGGSLDQCLKARQKKQQGPLDWQTACQYVADVGEGLKVVHQAGIVHRDIKPANILLDSVKEEAVLADFGAANLMSLANTAVGTPAYMAPEAFLGKATEFSDVFSLAATLYRLITGEIPFQSTALPEYILQVDQGLSDPDPLCQSMPATLEKLLRDTLRATPEERPPLATFLNDLRGTLNQQLSNVWRESNHQPQNPISPKLELKVRNATTNQICTPARISTSSRSKTRDIKKVPTEAPTVHLRTGDTVNLEVTSVDDGHLIIFNIGPTGNLNLLWPEDASKTTDWPEIKVGSKLLITGLMMEAPSGRERLVGLWSRTPRPVNLQELPSLLDEDSEGRSRPYRATRDIVRMQQNTKHYSEEDFQCTVLELEHGSLETKN